MTHSSLIAAVAVTLGLSTVAFAAAPNAADAAKVLSATSISTSQAIAAVEQQSGGKVVEIDLRDQKGIPAYHVSAMTSTGTTVNFIVDGRSGKVTPTTEAQAAVAADTTEAGEGPTDADSGNEDAN